MIDNYNYSITFATTAQLLADLSVLKKTKSVDQYSVINTAHQAAGQGQIRFRHLEQGPDKPLTINTWLASDGLLSLRAQGGSSMHYRPCSIPGIALSFDTQNLVINTRALPDWRSLLTLFTFPGQEYGVSVRASIQALQKQILDDCRAMYSAFLGLTAPAGPITPLADLLKPYWPPSIIATILGE